MNQKLVRLAGVIIAACAALRGLVTLRQTHSRSRLLLEEARYKNVSTVSKVEAYRALLSKRTTITTTAIVTTTVPRILLYFTTAGSAQHLTYLRCYPQFFKNLPILKNADVLVYDGTNPPPSKQALESMENMMTNWPNKVRKVVGGQNPGKQSGAMKAVHDALEGGWFKGYDWIIRLNPDVVIFDEAPLIALMQSNPSGIFANCYPWAAGEDKRLIHTDLFAVRPEKVNNKSFSNWNTAPNAEHHATGVFSNMIKNKEAAWLLDRNVDGNCRIRGAGFWHENADCDSLLRRHPWREYDFLP